MNTKTFFGMKKSIKTNVVGFPRIGKARELKKAEEAYWNGKITGDELLSVARNIRLENWKLQANAGISLVPSNDFSLYDQVLDQTVAVGAIPERYNALRDNQLELYFAMAHGVQRDGNDIIAMEMTKWFDTNYHYIVPEFVKNQSFKLSDTKAADEYREAKAAGIETKPVVIGPVSFLLLGKEKESGFSRLDLIDRLLPVFVEQLKSLENAGAEWVQIDEPCLVLDLDEKAKSLYQKVYGEVRRQTSLKIVLTTYFGALRDNAALALSLPTDAIHIDFVRGAEDFISILDIFPAGKILSLGVVDGRNIWKNDFEQSLKLIDAAVARLGADRVWVAASSSFLHVPYDLDLERDEKRLPAEIKRWLAFARQKVDELVTLSVLAVDRTNTCLQAAYQQNRADIAARKSSKLIHNTKVAERAANTSESDYNRESAYTIRSQKQQARLNLPLFPTTTIGSFPQTTEVRSWRARFRKGELLAQEYNQLLKDETARAVRWQEEAGLDVLVHGEFERNDMVEYFGEQLDGFVFTQNGWVQSYGSRCVKPPIIFGDVSRPTPMTIDWITFAQSLTEKPMKGMLTGPVTILQWSFVRNDQPRSETTKQIALAIRDEVTDLERAGIKVIQIDEPAIREGLPLRKSDWADYLNWAVKAFRLASSGVSDETQIHTHMCYSEFNDIIEHIAQMDADVITIECSRSQMELLNVFGSFSYPNGIGPGVYDIHSARVPSVDEIVGLMRKAQTNIPAERLWVNPDCGLKTRGWAETKASIANMIAAARQLRGEKK